MSEVKDHGSLRSILNSKLADLIAKCMGQRANYTIRYFSNRHRWPNFKNPKDLSERILSSMMSAEFLKYADYADKVKVREYVKSKGLGELLLEQYGVWENADQIDFNKLPDRFILKANNGSGGHVICTNKSELDIPLTIKKMNEAMNGAQHYKITEPHYCAIKPMILAEELMGDGIHLPFDYKFNCINGKVSDIIVASEREVDAKFCTFDTSWMQLPYVRKQYLPPQMPERPDHLEKMISIAEELSSDFKFVRVDLYDFQGKVYFGELSFSPWGGMLNIYTTDALDILGAKFEE